MKRILRLKQFVLVCIAAVAMTSCLENEDEPFQVLGNVSYIAQEINGQGESEFYPVISAQGFYGTMNTCKVTDPNKVEVPMTQVASVPGLWQTNMRQMRPMSTIPSGTYTLTGSTQEGETSTNSMSANVDKTMKIKLESTLKYNASNHEVTVTFKNEVENADVYQVMIEMAQYDAMFSILKSWKEADVTAAKDRTVTFTIPETDYTNLPTGTYRLVATAVITQSMNGYTLPLVVQQGAYTTFTK